MLGIGVYNFVMLYRLGVVFQASSVTVHVQLMTINSFLSFAGVSTQCISVINIKVSHCTASCDNSTSGSPSLLMLTSSLSCDALISVSTLSLTLCHNCTLVQTFTVRVLCLLVD